MTPRRLEALVDKRVSQALEEAKMETEDHLLMRQMEISMLQAQINPHFLYNTLECIRGQAIADNEPQIAETIHALSGYYRYNISNRREVVPIKDELDNVSNYMKIQQYRFQDRFAMDIETECDDIALQEGTLPKLSLQPLVENAVLHGFRHITEGAHIRIHISQTEKSLNIIVSDNGEGMSEEDLVRLRHRITRNASDRTDREERHGIALVNVNRRIQLLFGESYGLTINSVENAGTDVEIHIPYIK